MVETGYEQWVFMLAFRDYLREYKNEAMRYAALKRELAARFRDDRVAYGKAKSDFIQAILTKAGKRATIC